MNYSYCSDLANFASPVPKDSAEKENTPILSERNSDPSTPIPKRPNGNLISTACPTCHVDVLVGDLPRHMECHTQRAQTARAPSKDDLRLEHQSASTPLKRKPRRGSFRGFLPQAELSVHVKRNLFADGDEPHGIDDNIGFKMRDDFGQCGVFFDRPETVDEWRSEPNSSPCYESPGLAKSLKCLHTPSYQDSFWCEPPAPQTLLLSHDSERSRKDASDFGEFSHRQSSEAPSFFGIPASYPSFRVSAESTPPQDPAKKECLFSNCGPDSEIAHEQADAFFRNTIPSDRVSTHSNLLSFHSIRSDESHESLPRPNMDGSYQDLLSSADRFFIPEEKPPVLPSMYDDLLELDSVSSKADNNIDFGDTDFCVAEANRNLFFPYGGFPGEESSKGTLPSGKCISLHETHTTVPLNSSESFTEFSSNGSARIGVLEQKNEDFGDLFSSNEVRQSKLVTLKKKRRVTVTEETKLVTPREKEVQSTREKEVQSVLHPCPDCHRNFSAEALKRHVPICLKVFGSSRRPVDFRAKRAKDTALEYFVPGTTHARDKKRLSRSSSMPHRLPKDSRSTQTKLGARGSMPARKPENDGWKTKTLPTPRIVVPKQVTRKPLHTPRAKVNIKAQPKSRSLTPPRRECKAGVSAVPLCPPRRNANLGPPAHVRACASNAVPSKAPARSDRTAPSHEKSQATRPLTSRKESDSNYSQSSGQTLRNPCKTPRDSFKPKAAQVTPKASKLQKACPRDCRQDEARKEVPPSRFEGEREVPPSRFETQREVPPTRFEAQREGPPSRFEAQREVPPTRFKAQREVSPFRYEAQREVSPFRYEAQREASPFSFEAQREVSFSFEAQKEVPPSRFEAQREVPPSRFEAQREVPPSKSEAQRDVPPFRFEAQKEVPPTRFEAQEVPPSRFVAQNEVHPSRFEAQKVPPTRFEAQKEVLPSWVVKQKEVPPTRSVAQKEVPPTTREHENRIVMMNCWDPGPSTSTPNSSGQDLYYSPSSPAHPPHSSGAYEPTRYTAQREGDAFAKDIASPQGAVDVEARFLLDDGWSPQRDWHDNDRHLQHSDSNRDFVCSSNSSQLFPSNRWNPIHAWEDKRRDGFSDDAPSSRSSLNVARDAMRRQGLETGDEIRRQGLETIDVCDTQRTWTTHLSPEAAAAYSRKRHQESCVTVSSRLLDLQGQMSRLEDRLLRPTITIAPAAKAFTQLSAETKALTERVDRLLNRSP